MGSKLTLAIQTQMLKIPLMWTGIPSVQRQHASSSSIKLQLPLQKLSKHLQLILLRLHLTTRWYHCKCFRRNFLNFFKGLKIHKKPQASSLSYNFKLSKLPVQCSASPTPTRSFVWCPAKMLLPRFSVSPKMFPAPVCPGLTAAMWSSCGAPEHACECRRVHPTYPLSHIYFFYGRVSTRIVKIMFKSNRRQIFDEYRGKTAGREGVGNKVWTERLSCPALPCQVLLVVWQMAVPCLLWAKAPLPSQLLACRLWMRDCLLQQVPHCTVSLIPSFCGVFRSVLAIAWLPAAPGEQSTPLLGREGWPWAVGDRDHSAASLPGCSDLGAAFWLVMCSSTSQQSRKHGPLTQIPAAMSPGSLCVMEMLQVKLVWAVIGWRDSSIYFFSFLNAKLLSTSWKSSEEIQSFGKAPQQFSAWTLIPATPCHQQ